jgi:hypothetical protein
MLHLSLVRNIQFHLNVKSARSTRFYAKLNSDWQIETHTPCSGGLLPPELYRRCSLDVPTMNAMWRSLLVPFLLCAISASAEDSRVLHSNGLFWKSLSENERIVYLEGYTSGYGESALEAASLLKIEKTGTANMRNTLRSMNYDGVPFGQLVSGVDSCYEDFRNQQLDVGDCLSWAKMGIDGWSDDRRQTYLRALRANYSH